MKKLLLVILLIPFVFADSGFQLGFNSTNDGYLELNPNSNVCYLDGNNYFTGNNTMDFLTVYNFTVYNYTGVNLVNGSDFWDDLDDPSDINAGDITDDGTYLTSESDPVYSSWDKSTGISITESQISDLDHFTNADETDSLSLHLNQDNFYDDGWIIYDETEQNFTFNTSKLSTVYYNATSVSAIAGTVDDGTLEDTQHPDGNYDGISFNFSEEAGSPGLDLRMNFTGIESFNRGVIRYKTSSLAGDYPIIQLWSYTESGWEDYPLLAETESFNTITQPVFDDTEHIQNEIVQMRLYKASNGNTNNHYYIDWVAISKGYGTPSGEEVDPFSIHRDGNIPLTGNWDVGSYNISGIDTLTSETVNATIGLFQSGVAACLLNGTNCNITYSDLNSLNNFSLDDIATNLGNWSADSGDYYTSAEVDTIFTTLPNLSIDDINGSIGNWSQDRVNYINDTTINNGSFVLNNTDNDYSLIADNVTSTYVNNIDFTNVSVSGNIITMEIVII